MYMYVDFKWTTSDHMNAYGDYLLLDYTEKLIQVWKLWCGEMMLNQRWC